MEVNPDVVTLYRYFLYAVEMRIQFGRAANEGDILKSDKISSFATLFFCSKAGIFFSYSYSGIYLVIEGWRDLKLKDEKIDTLLESPYVDRLRLFRNATFHYQKEMISWKHMQFFGTQEEATEKWLNQLYNEFGRYFKQNTIPIPEALKIQLENKSNLETSQIIQDYFHGFKDK